MQIAVIGTSETEDKDALQRSYRVGQLLAEQEVVLVCGGLTGVMSEASRGAFEKGGDVLAVLPTLDPSDANPWVTHVVATGISHARNLAVVASSDSVIAVGGQWGTLSEIAFARRLGLQVVCLNSWSIGFPQGEDPGLILAQGPEQAVQLAIENALTRERSEYKSERADNLLD